MIVLLMALANDYYFSSVMRLVVSTTVLYNIQLQVSTCMCRKPVTTIGFKTYFLGWQSGRKVDQLIIAMTSCLI